MAAIDRAYNIDDIAAIARRRLPNGLYEFIERGAEDEVTARANMEAIKRTLIRQRVGIDVSEPDISTTLFGVKQTMPIGVGVTGLVGILAYEGEYKIARAAASAGIPYTLGNANFAELAKCKEICGDLLWRQLYPLRQPIMDHYVAQAKELGIRVLVITMDSAIHGNREYMYRNGFMPGMTNRTTYWQTLRRPSWFIGTILRYMLHGGLPKLPDMPAEHQIFFGKGNSMAGSPVASFSWDSLRELRKAWPGILVVKGISTSEDAVTAVGCGADGVIVSNHGGRSLDGCVPSFGALPGVVDAIGGRATVMVDGSFKRGADILKAIAVGASAVMVGRTTTFGLAAAGQAGVAKALDILSSETRRALALMGCTRLDQLDRNMLQFPC